MVPALRQHFVPVYKIEPRDAGSHASQILVCQKGTAKKLTREDGLPGLSVNAGVWFKQE
jgi:hypothetical protein